MSIHKSQGQMIHCVKIDLKKVFEKGSYTTAIILIHMNIKQARPMLLC